MKIVYYDCLLGKIHPSSLTSSGIRNYADLHSRPHPAFLFADPSGSVVVLQEGYSGLIAHHRNTVALLETSHGASHQLLPRNLFSELTTFRISN